jgi:benzoyl-CoA 2,3-dioxygenase component B
LHDAHYRLTQWQDGRLVETEVPALSAINERLRDDYIADCQRGVDRWNKIIAEAGIDYVMRLPHRAFHRRIGQFADLPVTPDGRVVDAATWAGHRAEWLPTAADAAYVQSLMRAVTTAGEFAGWIAPPRIGINNQPLNFDYVRL